MKTTKEVLATTLLAAVFAVPFAFATTISCKIDDGGDEDGSAGSGDDPTCNCGGGQEFGRCVCFTGANFDPACNTDGGCTADCIAATGMGGNFNTMECSTNPDSGSCSSWNPASHINLTGGVRYVNASWFASVVANRAPLWTCDDAILDDLSTGKFKVLQANSGEMMYELGLRNNDIPQTLNSMPLNGVYDAFDAFYALYATGVTSYSLVVRRGTTNITLLYVLN